MSKIEDKENNKENNKEKENLVNGPVNAFRLEGKIGDNNKVIYLFGDYHNPISLETKCDSFLSKDFTNYFYSTIRETDNKIKYDLLFENFADIDMFEQYKYSYSNFREKYISELRKYIDSDMDILEFKNKKLENKGSRKFKNLRLHYLDIRSFYGSGDYFKLSNDIKYFMEQHSNNNQLWIIDRLVVSFSNLGNELMALGNHLNLKSLQKEMKFENKIKIDDEKLSEEIEKYQEYISGKKNRMEKYSQKLFGKYNHENVKKNMMGSILFTFILSEIKKAVKKISICLEKLLQIKELYKITYFDLAQMRDGSFTYGNDVNEIKKLLSHVNVKNNSIYTYWMNIFVNITDLYLLRRFLDKDYIERGIVYTGMHHTQNYVQTLVKEFGFKITHADYTKLGIEETNKWLQNNTDEDPGKVLLKPKFKQCVDMDNFPKDFL